MGRDLEKRTTMGSTTPRSRHSAENVTSHSQRVARLCQDQAANDFWEPEKPLNQFLKKPDTLIGRIKHPGAKRVSIRKSSKAVIPPGSCRVLRASGLGVRAQVNVVAANERRDTPLPKTTHIHTVMVQRFRTHDFETSKTSSAY